MAEDPNVWTQEEQWEEQRTPRFNSINATLNSPHLKCILEVAARGVNDFPLFPKSLGNPHFTDHECRTIEKILREEYSIDMPGPQAMARPFVKIKDLNEAAGLSRIGVRIISLWIVQKPPKPGHLEMILMDSQGDQIQVTMKKEEFAEWCRKLEQNKTYIMENFSIVRNEEKYKACNHPYKMIFISATTLKQKDIVEIPPFKYHFTSFGDIINGKVKTGLLVDVIGAVEKAPYSNQKMAAFCLKDLNLDTIQCTLWDELGNEFMEFWAQQAQPEMVVVILRHARIKEPQGKYPIALSNTYNNATKAFTNQDLEEIKEFKSRIGLKIVLVQSSLISPSQMSSYSQFTELDKFMYKAQSKTIADINSYNGREVQVGDQGCGQ